MERKPDHPLLRELVVNYVEEKDDNAAIEKLCTILEFLGVEATEKTLAEIDAATAEINRRYCKHG